MAIRKFVKYYLGLVIFILTTSWILIGTYQSNSEDTFVMSPANNSVIVLKRGNPKEQPKQNLTHQNAILLAKESAKDQPESNLSQLTTVLMTGLFNQEKNKTRQVAEVPPPIITGSGKTKLIHLMQGWQVAPEVTNTPLASDFERYSETVCGAGYKCRLTRHGQVKNAYGTDLAVFYGQELSDLPPRRPPNMLWLFHTIESQMRVTSKHLQAWDNQFNYSIEFTRKTNSRFSFASEFVKLDKPLQRNFAQERREKFPWVNSPKALWYISNCATAGVFRVTSARLQYALELSNHITINAYTRRSETCRYSLGKLLSSLAIVDTTEMNDFMFYLAFENSLCKDYITEKLFKIWRDDIYTIPIVMGGLDIKEYEAIAPPNSFIHVKNFSSPADLANHLKFVAENDEAFNYYNEWRNHYIVKPLPHPRETLCHYCRLAHDSPPGLWKTFSTDFAPSNCLDITKPEKYCSYYNLTTAACSKKPPPAQPKPKTV